MLQQPGPIWREQQAKDTAEEEGGERKIQCKALLICLVVGRLEKQTSFLSFSIQTHREVRLKQLLTDKLEPAMEDSTSPQSHSNLLSSYHPPPSPSLTPSSSCLLTLGRWDRCINDRNTAKLKCCLVLLQAALCRYLWFLWYHRSIYCQFTWLICWNDCRKGWVM